METKLFRVRTKDGHVSPVKPGITNVHGTDMANVIVPAKVAVAIMKGKLRFQDAVRCVLAGKDPTVLLKSPDAVKPRDELKNAPDFDGKKEAGDLAPNLPDGVKSQSELALARQEGRAPDLTKLTEDELAEFAGLVQVDPKKYKTQLGLIKAVQRALDEAAPGNPAPTVSEE